jgi:hypothetical protein
VAAQPVFALARTRRALIWAIALTALGLALCFIPLLNVLGYESAFVIGVTAAIASADLGTLAPSVAAARARSTSPTLQVLAIYGEAAATGLLLALIPALLLALNALRVKNCDLWSGWAAWTLLSVGDALAGAAVGTLAGLALPGKAPRPARNRLARVAAVLTILASFIWGLVRFYRTPAIFAYDPFAGFFSGSLYDENVPLGRTLLLYRLMNVALVAAALGIAALVLTTPSEGEFASLRLSRPPWKGRSSAIVLAAAGLLIGVPLFVMRGSLGFAPDADDIARALGGRRETQHFIIYYPLGTDTARDIDLIASDHEFRYAELTAELGVEPIGPGEKIKSFLFASADQKQALMGAAETFIAKPWLKQIYLQAEPFPMPILMHEMGHVFAGAFGDSLFHISVRWRFAGLPYPAFNVGLIEGAAVAADWSEPDQALTPHEWSRAMDELGLLPPLDQVFGLSFFGSNAAISYTVAGSFCRWLIDTRGIASFRDVYRSGGDFAAAYGQPLGDLETQWHAFLETVPVSPEALAVARERFTQPGLFGQVCAHAIADEQARAQSLLAAGRKDEAVAALRAIVDEDPGQPGHLLDLMHGADQVGAYDAALEAAQKLAADPGASTPLRARALLEQGDLAWRRHDLSAAADAFDQVTSMPVDTPTHRLALGEKTAVDDPTIEPFVRPLFEGEPSGADGAWRHDDAAALFSLALAVQAEPQSGLANYLIGRQLLGRALAHQALPYLEAAATLGLPDDTFERENLRQLAMAQYREHDPTAAAATLRLLDADGVPPAERLAARDFLRRIAWEAGQPLPVPLTP